MPVATPDEIIQYPPPAPPQWITGPQLLPCPEYQIQFLRKGSNDPFWVSSYGPQTWMLLSPFDETIAGGSRGGGKSSGLIAWFAVGDPFLDDDDPAHYLSILEPSFRGLMLRKEYQSMAEFVDEAYDFYGPLGATKKGDPVQFEFPSGAIIYTNHLGDKNAFEKYRGWGLSKIGIEELTQIEEERWYLKLLGSLRAKKQIRIHGRRRFRALRSQIMSTTNPDGAGSLWVKKRFVKVYDATGKLIPWNRPFRNPQSKLTRLFIPMPRKDNPYLRNDRQYESYLLEQDETTRRQWMLGDWDADSGSYFTDFRPHGPVSDEERKIYPNARHVPIVGEEPKLQPWWYRFGGGDWGYDHPAAFHKMCRSEKTGQIHVYDEMILRKTGSFEMGVRLAYWWLPELEQLPDKTVVISFSSDAFNTQDSGHTRAEQVSEGIRSVLGPYGAFLLRFTDEERMAMQGNPMVANQMFSRRVAALPSGVIRILIKPASRDRSGGFSYMRDLLRFRPVVRETEADIRKRLQEVFDRSGLEVYERESARVRQHVDEHLPKLLIWNNCQGLIRCMEDAVRDEDKTEEVRKVDAQNGVGGDDPMDSCFVAGTLVTTGAGPRRIEEIQVGDLVWTRDGLKPVTHAGCTGTDSQVFRLLLSNGATLDGTGNHPIFINKTGFSRLDTLRYGDTLDSCQTARQSSSTELNFGDTLTPQNGTSETTISHRETINTAASAPFIGRFGSLFTGVFRQGSISTIATRIPSTTIFQTLRQSLKSFITESTVLPRLAVRTCGEFSLSVYRRQQTGIDLKQAGRRAGEVPSFSEMRRTWKNHASNAQRYLLPSNHYGSDSAHKNAKLRGGVRLAVTIWKESVRHAQNVLSAISLMTPKPVPVHVVAVQPHGRAPVYNLTVADCPEYYANGILVHNCRHGLRDFKEVEKTMPKVYFVQEQIERIQTEYEENVGERITDINRLIMINRTQSDRFDGQHPKSTAFTPTRLSSMRHRQPHKTRTAKA